MWRVPLSLPFRRAEYMGMAAPVYWTAEMVRALPEDGNRYETVHGELLVSPSPRMLHQRIVARLVQEIGSYLEREPVGEVFAGGDISWSDDTLVVPDVLVAPLGETRTMDWRHVRSLMLAVEVLSPSSQRADRFTKRRLYQEVGVPLYLLVDADARSVEMWTPDVIFPTVESERVVWHPAGAGEPLVIDLARLFRAV